MITLAKLKKLRLDKPIVSKHHQFSYFLNMHMNEEWFGSVVANWGYFKDNSISLVRNDVRTKFEFATIYDEHFGYHFTSCGSVNLIKNKIKSYSHQEFNNFIVLFFLSYNIKSGHDIFGRSFKKYRIINLNESQKYYDHNIRKIILKYSNLLNFSNNKKTIFIYSIFFILVKIPKYIYQLFSRIKFNI